MTADEITRLLKLQPLPQEGGFFVETYRSPLIVSQETLGKSYAGERAISTAIYYFLTPDVFSAMHRLPGDEVFHFYMGDTVEMLQLKPDGSGRVLHLGQDLALGERPQVLVSGRCWQGARLAQGGHYALLGATMAPGFDFADFETGSREELSNSFPEFASLITALTRS